jgi:hypothetical protein
VKGTKRQAMANARLNSSAVSGSAWCSTGCRTKPRGTSRIMVLFGEPGVRKTALLAYLSRPVVGAKAAKPLMTKPPAPTAIAPLSKYAVNHG